MEFINVLYVLVNDIVINIYYWCIIRVFENIVGNGS